jgi:hypothetical protein
MESLIYQVGVQGLVMLLRRHADTGEPIDLVQAFQLMTFVSVIEWIDSYDN